MFIEGCIVLLPTIVILFYSCQNVREKKPMTTQTIYYQNITQILKFERDFFFFVWWEGVNNNKYELENNGKN